jgi:hypothetical protein
MGGGVPQGERLDVRAGRCVLPGKRRDGRARGGCASLRLRVVRELDHAAARACIATVRAAVRGSSIHAAIPMRSAAALIRRWTAPAVTRRSSSTARTTSSSDGSSMIANDVAACARTGSAADSSDPRYQPGSARGSVRHRPHSPNQYLGPPALWRTAPSVAIGPEIRVPAAGPAIWMLVRIRAFHTRSAHRRLPRRVAAQIALSAGPLRFRESKGPIFSSTPHRARASDAASSARLRRPGVPSRRSRGR